MPISVVKRSGKRELVSFDQILERVQSQSSGLNVDPVSVAQTVVQGIRDGITTSELDKFTVETAAAMAVRARPRPQKACVETHAHADVCMYMAARRP